MVLSSLKNKITKLPQSPGVYLFFGAKKEMLYVGKATNLRSRVQSYFRGGESARLIGMVLDQVVDIKTIEVDSVLEALILESNLIKKYQPKYNAMGKDDKSFSYFIITKEKFPRILIVRKTDIAQISNPKFLISNQIPKTKNQISKNILDTKYQIPYTKAFGPYTSKKQMEVALKIMRKIFPFHSAKQNSEKNCLDFQIGLCPGPYAGAISKQGYRKNIRGIKMILEGKKKNLVKKLEKEMSELAQRHEFEKAGEVRNKIFALKHIHDVALISKEENFPSQGNKRGARKAMRIEAYDISNISGQYAVGSMVVFQNGEPDKAQYRKFKIKTVEGSDDVGMLREVLLRRFNNDWPAPDLILLDGGMGHANMGSKLLSDFELAIPLVAIAKGRIRKISNFKFQISNQIPMLKFSNEVKNILADRNLIWGIMSEAHRFAITYHKKIRNKQFLA